MSGAAETLPTVSAPLLLLFWYVFVVEVVQIVEGEGKPSMQQLGEWLSVVKQEVVALRLSSMRER